MQIMTAQTTPLRTLYDHAVLNSVMFPQFFCDIVLYAGHFLPVKFFFPKYYFSELCFELPQNVSGPMNNARDKHEYRHKWKSWRKIGKNGRETEKGDLPFFLSFFWNSAW